MNSYGVPYKGSKNLLATKILSLLPNAKNFYDTFAGGCAITHCALLSNKYQNIFTNDINGDIIYLFREAIAGNFHHSTEWVSSEDFNKLKDTDPFIKYIWSFGNNGKNYLYSQYVEDWKMALHFALVFNDLSILHEMNIYPYGNVRTYIRNNEEYCKRQYIKYFYKCRGMNVPTQEDIRNVNNLLEKTKSELLAIFQKALRDSGKSLKDINDYTQTHMASHWFSTCQWQFPTPAMYAKLKEILPSLPNLNNFSEVQSLQSLQGLQSLQSLQGLQSLQMLQSLQRLQRLQMLQRLQRLQSLQGLYFTTNSYEELTFEPNSVIYCDPPYRNTSSYGNDFNHENFYNWCEKQTNPIYISEYDMPRDRFKCIAEFSHTSKMSRTNTKNIERLFVPINQADKNRELCLF